MKTTRGGIFKKLFKRRVPRAADFGVPQRLVAIKKLTIDDISIDPSHPLGVRGLPEEYAVLLEHQKGDLTAGEIADNIDAVFPILQRMVEGTKEKPTHERLVNDMQSVLDIQKHDPGKKYKFGRMLGHGAGGKVFEATTKGAGKVRKVAVKVSNPPQVHSDDENPMNSMEAERELVRAMENEIAFHAMSKHPNVVELIECFLYDGNFFVVLEVMDGGALTPICSERATWSERAIAYVAQQTLQALEYLHNQHTTHRDIKSDNILYNLAGEVKIADFGFAAGLTKTREQHDSVVGTPFWMAPELIKSEPYTAKVDIWSLGITLIECAEGDPPLIKDYNPFKAMFHIATSPPPELDFDRQWTEAFHHYVKVSLRKDPAARPSSRFCLMHPFVQSACSAKEFTECVKDITRQIRSNRPGKKQVNNQVLLPGQPGFQ